MVLKLQPDQERAEQAQQVLAVGQAGEYVVVGHALQAVFRLVAQAGVALDGGEQLVGGADPQPQLVLLVALEHR